MASVNTSSTRPPVHIEPTEVYRINNDTTSPVKLRIATGGAGQSGLIRAFALAFIEHEVRKHNAEPFAVAWCASDTTVSFNSLALRAVDLSITYHPVAEQIALDQGVADRREYAWRDHWLLVGPKSNPACLSTSPHTSIYTLFTQLFRACVRTQATANPIRFLSRYDKSANNIKESALWAAIGQTPWSYPYSQWYHQYVEFPFGALRAASRLGEYTVTDRGTWCMVEDEVRGEMSVFVSLLNLPMPVCRGAEREREHEGEKTGTDGLRQKEGGDAADDPMLNPAHVLVGVDVENKAVANRFVDWLVDERGGQAVVRTFASRNGQVLYSPAPGKGKSLIGVRSRL